MLAEYDIHYSNEKILNCFPNDDINSGESIFFVFFLNIQTEHLRTELWGVSQLRFSLCQAGADGKRLMNLTFHKHYEFSQIAQSIPSKLTAVFPLGPRLARGISLGHTSTALIGINDVLILFFFTSLPPPPVFFFYPHRSSPSLPPPHTFISLCD